MSIGRINWKKGTTTTSLGRNGTITTTGVEVSFFNYFTPLTSISPITSKGQPGRCSIEIPTESCPYQALEALVKKMGKNLPTLMGIHPFLDQLIAAKLSGKEST